MADLVRSSTSEEEDPLDACSNLSLFPRTLKSLSISPPLPPQSEDLQQTHTLLQSMPFEVQKEHQEQGNGTSVASEDTNVGVKMNLIANKRERRPGLDRKNRGKFTFKPVMSEAPQNKPTFDGKKYPKPEDYFAEYAKYKNAIREWEKQTGTTVTDTHENQPLRRPRGPGMPGRKRGSYKHTYSDSFLADLKAFEKESSIPSEQNLEKTITADVPTPDREVDDSTVDSDKHLENVLSTLLACSPDKLEGDACVKLLEKHLHLEPIDEQIFSFPEFPDVRRMNSKASGRTPSKGRTALSNIQNLLKEKNTNATRKSSKSPSPNPPEDQFSFPDRHHLLPGDLQSREADLAKDLNVSFRSSVANNADKVITNASPSNVGTVYVASPFNSSVKKSSNEVESDTQSDIHRSHSSLDGNADNCVDDSITKRNSATIEVDADMPTKRNEVDVTMSESEVNRDTRRRENDADINEETTNLLDNLAEYASREGTRSDPFTPEKDGIPNQQDETTKSPNRAPEEYNTMDGSFEHVEDIQGTRGEENEYVDTACGTHEEENENVDTACGTHGEENENVDTACGTQDVHNASEKQTRKRRKKGCCYHTKKKRSKTVHDKGEGEKQTETSPHENGVKKQTQRKAKEPEDKKQKKTVTREGEIFSRRKSLAAVGTKWESGVRRSTRIRSRPLEYWRGERFLYGRIHESLTTIIGIKYSSPDKNRNENERPALKVKSFVPDEYKHLVDLAALH